MPLDPSVIAAIFGQKAANAPQRAIGPIVPIRSTKLTNAIKEPRGWPLTRPVTPAEWQHVIKVMVVRRVPKTSPVNRGKLVGHVTADVTTASDAGRIYVASDFSGFCNASTVLAKLVNDKVLRTAADSDEDGGPSSIYRTENTSEWEKLIPAVVRAVVDYMPVTDVLDLMVDALNDSEQQ